MPIEKLDSEQYREEAIVSNFGEIDDDILTKQNLPSLEDGERISFLFAVLFELDLLIDNPHYLGLATPEKWYELLLDYGYNITPLTDGRHKGRDFSDGGGFKIVWGGDRLLMYHPDLWSRHDGRYWKLASGEIGVRRYDMMGKEK